MATIKSVNQHLRELREDCGKTQKEAADFLGHGTAQYISNLEREICTASVEMAIRLSDFYGGNRNELYELMLQIYKQSLKRRFSSSK